MRLARFVVGLSAVAALTAACATGGSPGPSAITPAKAATYGYATQSETSHDPLPGPCSDGFDPGYIARDCW